MPNEALRAAILASGLGIEGAAEGVGVDRKTVERWIAGRLPYRRHQYALASLLGVDLRHLWADQNSAQDSSALSQMEVLAIYPCRSAVPLDQWMSLFRQAKAQLDILAFAGFWLSEDHSFHRLLEDKANHGVPVRILLGDPESSEVERRGIDEGIGATMAGKIRNAILNYGTLLTVDGIEFRLHHTTLYNSLYRSDDEMVVNTHVYGEGAHRAPVLHLRRVPGGELFPTYARSFERVWSAARPLEEIASGSLTGP